MELIDKSALVVEIKRLRERAYELYGYSQFDTAYNNVLESIDTFEVKDIENMLEDAKDEAMRDIAWKVHVMISEGKSIAEIDHFVTGICDF